MTQRLLALCFGLPVNAGHADGISHSLRDQFTITIIVFCRQAAVKPIWAASLSGEMVLQNGPQRALTGCVSKDGMVFLLTMRLTLTLRLENQACCLRQTEATFHENYNETTNKELFCFLFFTRYRSNKCILTSL